MVDLGQTGGSNSACLFFIPTPNKKPTAFAIGFEIVKKNFYYFSTA